jgi:hypothetical protein
VARAQGRQSFGRGLLLGGHLRARGRAHRDAADPPPALPAARTLLDLFDEGLLGQFAQVVAAAPDTVGKTGEDMGYFTAVYATRDVRQAGVVSVGLTDVAAEAGLATAGRLAVAAFAS